MSPRSTLPLGVLLAAGSLAMACGSGAPPAETGASVTTTHEIEETAVQFTAGGREIQGRVPSPDAAGPWPAVLLLAGSGPTDRDWMSPLLPGTNGSA